MNVYKRPWKEPVNGLTAFFTEESFNRVLGNLSATYEKHSNQPPIQTLTPYQVKQGPSEKKKKSDVPIDDRKIQIQPQKTEADSVPPGKSAGAPTQKPKAQKSTLSSKEQRRYLELFHKYLISFRPQQPSPAEIKELTEFESLQLRVSNEQAAFLQYTEQVAKSRHFDYNHLLPSARKYVNEKLTSQYRRVDHYPRYYVPEMSIPIVVVADQDYHPTLVHEKLLVEMGTFPKVFMPDMTRQTEVLTQYEKVNKRFPSHGRKVSNTKSWNHESCSRDTNCEVLALRHGCQLVTCTSALRCLVDNHGPKFDQEWDIPVIVRQCERDYGDIVTKQKIVYIDKPFASKDMTNREKNTMYHKYALKTFITQVAHNRGHRQTPASTTVKDDVPVRPDSANPFDNDVSMEDIETFGSLDFGTANKKPQKSLKEESMEFLSSLKEITQKSKKSGEKTNSKSKSEAPIKKDLSSGNLNEESVKTSENNPEEYDITESCERNPVEKSCDVQKKSETKEKDSDVAESKVQLVSSGADSSPDDSLMIDIPDLDSPPCRATRSRTKKDATMKSTTPEPVVKSLPRRSSSRISKQTTTSLKEAGDETKPSSAVTDTSDDEPELVIDLGDISSPDQDKRKTRSQVHSDEFPVPKRVLRSMKTGEGLTAGESDAEGTSDPISQRLLRTRSGSGKGSRSRSNSESMSVYEKTTSSDSSTYKEDDPKKTQGVGLEKSEKKIEAKSKGKTEAHLLFSPSKVDNIMIKTSTDDLSQLPLTIEGRDIAQSKVRGKRSGLTSEIGLSPLDSILQLQERMLPAGKGKSDGGAVAEEQLSDLSHPEEHNVAYNLWSFSGLTLLIRSSCHGHLRDMTLKTQPVCIVPKLEYQAKFGVEQVTMSEVARDWVTCYVKPNTRLVRGRINGLTSELMKIDEMDLNGIVNPSLPFEPRNAQASLHNLFLKMTELPVGQYILSHKKGENSCQLLKNTENKRGSYDLKFSYMGFGQPMEARKGEVPWIPVDPTVLLPIHRRQGRVPCTFEPPDYVSNTVKKNIKKKKAQKKKQWQKKGNVKRQ